MKTDRQPQQPARAGVLIALEGIDGTGKSTQQQLLAQRLRQLGLEVVVTREPTDGPYGRRLRELFLNRASLSPEEELQLFLADRREHVAKLIEPALKAGRVVITDRYYYSTAAYQGASGHDPAAILAINESFAPRPDLVLLLEAPPAVGVRRVQEGRGESLNDFEQEDYLRRVAGIFAGFSAPGLVRVNATGAIEQVQVEIWQAVEALLMSKKMIAAKICQQW
ncbi:dTMP kinase [Desulfurivibrio alkaliphilus]|uniref:Thymidylate kinase n=1 Tax=Desulfurivibrio alkaliphilus (strain DSM 19089 / UNIQEM U267 / AHT2) TaxID=589865 RepID=D6Z2T7_DESAT|nr:dTMP kinase [Desulfurivibrio alkaliphilus]ADH85862.1 thymidylate kinase [Desulfurivibrio alkaliphilus AHT 2]